MLDLKLHLITILSNVIFLGLTKLAKARLGRNAVQTSTQTISSYLQFPQTSWGSHVFQPSWSTNTPHLCHSLANCMFHPTTPWLIVPFPLPPSCPSSFSHFPSCKHICSIPTWTPDSSVALPSCRSSLRFTQFFTGCPVQPGLQLLFPLIRANTASLQPLLPSHALQDPPLAESGGSPTLSHFILTARSYSSANPSWFHDHPPNTFCQQWKAGGVARGNFPDEFSPHHNLEMAPSSTKGSGNVCRHQKTPQHNFYTAWEAACRAACKTAQDMGQEKSKQKLIFCRRAGGSGCSAAQRRDAPQGRLANTCSFQDFKMHFVTLLPANSAEMFQRTGISAYCGCACERQSPPRPE